MADVFTPEKRSEIMSRIRSSGTTPKARLCAAVREALGGRWRIDVNVRTLPGQPDVVVPGLGLAIFADEWFYHGCPEHGHVPKSNVGYWLPKLVRNRRRGRASRRVLRRMGSRGRYALLGEVGQFFVQRLGVSADVEHPLPKLPPVVHGGHPPFCCVVFHWMSDAAWWRVGKMQQRRRPLKSQCHLIQSLLLHC